MNEKATHSLRIHLGLLAAEVICISAFVIEISRALSGNTLSWAYVVEWPILGAYAIYMWHKLLKDERSPEPTSQRVTDEVDPKLAAWNEYLARVHDGDQSNQRPK
jgi:heme oxygenase